MLADEDTTSVLAFAPMARASAESQLMTPLVEISIEPALESKFQPHIYKVVLVAVGVMAEMLMPPPVVAIEASVNGLLASL